MSMEEFMYNRMIHNQQLAKENKMTTAKYIQVLDRDINMLDGIRLQNVSARNAAAYLNSLVDRYKTAETLVEIVNRELGVAQPEVVTVPKLTKAQLLDQNEWWYSSTKGWTLISEMHPSHAKNTVKWLHANASSFYERAYPTSYIMIDEKKNIVLSSKLYNAILDRSWCHDES